MKKKWIGALLLGAMLVSAPGAALAETVTIDFDNPVVSVDAGKYVMNEVAGVNEDGVLLVPVRDVAEAFGGTVEYDAAANMVRLRFENGNWADIIIGEETDASADEIADGITDVGTVVDGRLYVSATLMATCLNGKVELIDYGRDDVYRLIYYVRK